MPHDHKAFKTEQEAFWAGDFGTAYMARNRGALPIASNANLFSRALGRCHATDSLIEFGANIGLNLRALQILFPKQEQHAIEINADAADELRSFLTADHVHQSSILDFTPQRTWDIVLIKGVLIHINPDALGSVYGKLVDACGRYLLVCEYYNPSPVAVPYRGHSDRLFKRDFAGEIMDAYPQMKLTDYGFVYRRDPNFPQDDRFLLEKR